MARARSIKPGFFKNEKLSELPMAARVLFAGLWTIADKAGRLEDRPKRIKAEVFPYENIPVEKLLNILDQAGFICRYSSGSVSYIAIPTWKKHQNPHVKEPESILPTPGQNSARTGISGTKTADSLFPITDSLNPEPDNRDLVREPENNLTREALSERYHEFVALWPKPTHVDEGAQNWIMLVDRGEITEANADKVFEGLERWKKSQLWKKGYKHGVAKWLLRRHWKDDPEQVSEEAW